MAGRPYIETEGAPTVPTAADDDCCTMAEICVWMAWTTEAKNSGEIETEAEVPGTRAGAEATVDKDVTAEAEHDATGNVLSKLFLVRRGGMANDEGKQTRKDKAKGAQRSAIE